MKYKGDKEAAAKELGISRRTIYRRIEVIRDKLGIEQQDAPTTSPTASPNRIRTEMELQTGSETNGQI